MLEETKLMTRYIGIDVFDMISFPRTWSTVSNLGPVPRFYDWKLFNVFSNG